MAALGRAALGGRAGWRLGLAAGLCLAAAQAQAQTQAPAQAAGRITGVGGVFVRSKDPAALARWYRDVLGLTIQPWGGAMLSYDAPGRPPVLVWNALPETTDYMAPSTREFMIDFAVDDMDAYLARLKAKGVTVLKRDDANPSGRFAWILDPDGVKIELWQARAR